jgi:hypothetical protein
MATVINGTDNTAATPALTGTDTDTGVFFPAANTMAFSTGGTEKMRVESSGNLNFTGTAQRITGDFSNATASNRVAFQSSTTNGATTIEVIPNGTGTSTGLFLESDSTITNSSALGLSLVGGTDARIQSLIRGSGTFLPMTFYTGGAERLRIDTSGNLLMGSTTNLLGARLDVKQSVATWAMGIQNTANNSGLAITNGSGTGSYTAIGFFNNGTTFSQCGLISVSGSSTNYGTSSDYRLKENIAPMTGALNKVAQLKPVTYRWKSTGEESQGFIAHELQEVVPECVIGEKDAVETVDEFDANGKKIGTKEVPRYQGIDTSFLVATLTAAIQELKATVDAQAARIAALENPAAPTPVES